MLNCPKCGYEIFEGSKFCPACGSPVKIAKNPDDIYRTDSVQNYDPFSKGPFGTPVQEADRFSQPDPFVETAFNSQQNSYNLFEQSYTQPVPRARSENHITFIFVTALIFMIIFIIRSFTSLISISDLQYFKDFAPNAYIATILYMVCNYIVCVAMIIFFCFAVSSRNSGKDIQKRARSSEILFILSIMVLLMEIVNFALQIYYIVIVEPYYQDFDINLQIISTLLFHIPFTIFSIINIVKSHALKNDLRQKSQSVEK